MPLTLARRAGLAAAAALALLAAPAPAATVTGGGFDWTMANHYISSRDDTLGQRTFLGYLTSPVSGPGSLAISGAATIADPTGAAVTQVTTAATRGIDQPYTITLPATGGTYDEYAGAGTIQLGGTVAITVHGRLQSFTDAKLVLDGDRGTLVSDGILTSGDPFTADTLITFDLASATVTLKANGSRVLGAVLRTAASSFFGPYPPSRGTESFAVRLRLQADEVRGPQGPAGPAGEPGKTTWLQTAVLKRAPYPDRKRHRISLLTTKGKRVVATGSVLSRTIRVRFADDAPRKRLRGVYLLKVGERQAVRVRVL